MNRLIRTALVLVVFAAVFLGLVVSSYRLESATHDEPQHLAAGYTALKLHDYRLDPEHPPLLRMWAALPLLAIPDIKMDANSSSWLAGDQWHFSHQFLYRDNDADRLLYPARFMIALLGVLLGILVFCWARELFGFWPAVIVLGLYCTEPNLLAHSGLVTTDLGVTCFIFGTAYFAWRIARNFSGGNLVGLITFFALAQVTKYSALLLVSVLVVLLAVRSLSPAPWPWQLGGRQPITSRARKVLLSALIVLGLLAVSYAALWGVYSFRYSPTPAGTDRFVTNEVEQERSPQAAALLQWVDEHHLLPNASAHGFALMAAKAQRRPAYLMGEVSDRGWWYYFPVALLIKTPVALLLLALAGLMLCAARRKTTGYDALFVVTPPAVYFAAAMAGHLNIGLRHVLPVYPFALLLAGWTIAALLPSAVSGDVRPRWRSLVLAVLCLTQLAELAVVYPHCLAFFNLSIGGPRQGARYLVDSNLDWGQGLKLLKQWMTQHHVDQINLSYFGHADPAYYAIQHTPLPGAPFFDQARITRPRLPGYVVVSATNLRCSYSGDFRTLYAPLREQTPVAVLGYSIYVYWVEQPWW